MMPTRLLLAIAILLATGCGARTGLLDPIRENVDGGLDAPSDASPDAPGADAPTPDATADAINDVVVSSLCPQALPALGEGCPVDGQVCAYFTGKSGPCDDVGQDDRVAWRCEEGAWLEIARCVDWSGCPGEPPAEGDPCLISATGLDCFYSKDDVCATSSIVQCDGAQWQHVNACPTRPVPAVYGLMETGPAGELTAVTHSEQQLGFPAIALAGTQMLMTYSLSAGYLPDHGIYGHFLQTAAPSQASLFSPTITDLLGADAVSNPRVTHSGGRFLLAWAANDGWPAHTDGVPGTYVRTIPLHEAPYSSPLVDEGGSAPTGIVMRPEGGRIAYRYAVPSDPSKYAAAVVVLSGEGEPAPLTKTTLADETASHGFTPPVPNAFVRIERWREGVVYAYPAMATGDAWDDSGLMVDFYETVEPNEEPKSVRLTVGMVQRASMAPIEDGSVVVAYVLANGELGPPYRLARVWADGSWEELFAPPQPGGGEVLGAGPVAVPFEDGFAVAWTSLPIETPAALGWSRVLVRTGSGLTDEKTWSQDVVGLGASDWIAMEYGAVDRTLHLAWSRDTQGLSTIERQRLIVRPY